MAYDSNGNLIQDKDNYYEYNSFNQLIRVRENNASGTILEEYTYKSNGDRIKKVEYLSSGGNNTYYYIGDDFVRKVNSSGTYNNIYYYHNEQTVGKNESGTMNFYHPDHLGSTTLITNSAGNTVEETSYYPFGLTLSGGTTKDKLYTGKELDGTNLYYYGARYYNPYIGLFTQPDPIIANIYNPQQLNRYSYVLNNPYKYIDPDGKEIFATSALIGLAYIIGALITAVSTGITMNKYYRGDLTYEQTMKSLTFNAITQGMSISGVTGIKGATSIEITGSTLGTGGTILDIRSDISIINQNKRNFLIDSDVVTTEIPDEITHSPNSGTTTLIEYENEILRQSSKAKNDIEKINRALNKIDNIENQYKEVYGEGYKDYWKESEAYKTKKKLEEQRRKLRNERKGILFGD